MTTQRSGRRVDVYVRAFEPVRDEHVRTVERLERLQGDGGIDGFDIHTWPSKIRLSERSIATDIIDRYERFDSWARDHDVSIRPPFEIHDTGMALLGEHDQALVLPAMCLTVTDGTAILGIYPCRVDSERISIDDCLDALEAGHDLPR